MKVLVTRPEEDAAETVRQLAERGYSALVTPMLEIRFRQDAEIDGTNVQAWLATSRNGVRALVHCAADRAIPLLAVGRSTAALAKDAGFSEVRDADGDLSDLEALVIGSLHPSGGRLVHAAGREVVGDLAVSLGRHGFDVERRVLYSAEAVSGLRSETRAVLLDRQIDAVLFFSARSAGAFASLVRDDEELSLALGEMVAICISVRAAAELDGLGFAETRFSDRPNQDALLAELDDFSGRYR
jgi:uroporphyrinogen-III synthase